MPRTRSLKWSELKIGIMAVVALLRSDPIERRRHALEPLPPAAPGT